MNKKVSIITASYNCWSELEKTLLSVQSLNYDNIEHIVIDGESKDGTPERILHYKNNIAVFVSEPDDGIADAWNKGLSFVTGEYVCILNSGDEYHPNFIVDNIEILENHPQSIVYGKTYITNAKGKIELLVDQKFKQEEINKSFGFLHTSMMTTKFVYDTVGQFNTSYKIALDIDWLLRAIKSNIQFIKSNAKNYMQKGGVSDKYRYLARQEYNHALLQHDFIHSKLQLFKLNAYFKFIGVLNFFSIFKIKSWIYSQLIFIALHGLNFLQNWLPFFMLRRWVHTIAGFKIDPSASIQSGGEFFAFKRLTIGKRTVINKNFILDNRLGIDIGEDVSIAHDVSIYTLGHDINCDIFSVKGAPVKVHDHAVIFAGAMIMPGVNIGRGAVIYPGAVVTKSVEDFAIVAGNPAKVVGKRNSKLSYSMKYKFWFGH